MRAFDRLPERPKENAAPNKKAGTIAASAAASDAGRHGEASGASDTTGPAQAVMPHNPGSYTAAPSAAQMDARAAATGLAAAASQQLPLAQMGPAATGVHFDPALLGYFLGAPGEVVLRQLPVQDALAGEAAEVGWPPEEVLTKCWKQGKLS